MISFFYRVLRKSGLINDACALRYHIDIQSGRHLSGWAFLAHDTPLSQIVLRVNGSSYEVQTGITRSDVFLAYKSIASRAQHSGFEVEYKLPNGIHPYELVGFTQSGATLTVTTGVITVTDAEVLRSGIIRAEKGEISGWAFLLSGEALAEIHLTTGIHSWKGSVGLEVDSSDPKLFKSGFCIGYELPVGEHFYNIHAISLSGSYIDVYSGSLKVLPSDVVRFSIDRVSDISVSGWCFALGGNEVVSMHLKVGGFSFLSKIKQLRLDVGIHFGRPEFNESGFEVMYAVPVGEYVAEIEVVFLGGASTVIGPILIKSSDVAESIHNVCVLGASKEIKSEISSDSSDVFGNHYLWVDRYSFGVRKSSELFDCNFTSVCSLSFDFLNKVLRSKSDSYDEFIENGNWSDWFYFSSVRAEFINSIKHLLEDKYVVALGVNGCAITRAIAASCKELTVFDSDISKVAAMATVCRDLTNVKFFCDNPIGIPEGIFHDVAISTVSIELSMRSSQEAVAKLGVLAKLVKMDGVIIVYIKGRHGLAALRKTTHGLTLIPSLHEFGDATQSFLTSAKKVPQVGDMTLPIRTVMVTHCLNHEGAPNSQMELTVGLQARGVIDPIVLSPLDGPLRVKYEHYGIPVHNIGHPFQGVFSTSDLNVRLREIGAVFKNFGAKVVYANTLETYWAILAAKAVGLPSIWNPRESEPCESYYNNLPSDLRSAAYSCFMYPYKIVFVSKATCNHWIGLNSSNNFKVIPNGLDDVKFLTKLKSGNREQDRANLGFVSTDIVFLLIGTITERKGQLDAILAMKLLDDGQLFNIKLILVGDRGGVYSEMIHEELAAISPLVRNCIMVISETDNVCLYYRVADVALCTSRIESYPRVILEAMAAGLPIISTSVFGIKEQVQEHVNALFYLPGDIDGLCEMIKLLALNSSLREGMRIASRGVYESLVTYDVMLQMYADVFYDTMLNYYDESVSESFTSS